MALHYAYTNNAGTAETGSLNLPYAAMTNDSVVGTPFPSGQINAVVGAAGVPVTVTFTTNDGLPASALQLTSSLSALPAGWSSNVTTFSCAGVSTGNGCQLALTYAPSSTVPASGTLMLAYSYINDVGVHGTGTVSINYQSTTSDSIVATPSQNPVSVAASGSAAVTVTFTTNDGNAASALLVTGGLANLPSGWTGPGTFGCQSVSTGNACTLSLIYAPTAVTTGPPPLSLNYSYDDDSGAHKTGSVGISYAATPLPHLYVADFDSSVLYCSVAVDGSLTACSSTGGGSGIVGAAGIAFYGENFAYVADYLGNALYLCNVAADGSFSSCNAAGGGFQFSFPWLIAVEGTTLYVTILGGTGGVDACAIAVDGTLSNCGAANVSGAGAPGTAGIAVGASRAYIGVGPTTVELCAVSAQGVLSNCAATATNSVFNNLDGINLSGGYAYVADEAGAGVSVCSVDATLGTLSACVLSPIANSHPDDVAFDGTHAYVSDFDSGAMNICTVGANGALTNCAPTQVSAPNPFPPANQIAIH